MLAVSCYVNVSLCSVGNSRFISNKQHTCYCGITKLLSFFDRMPSSVKSRRHRRRKTPPGGESQTQRAGLRTDADSASRRNGSHRRRWRSDAELVAVAGVPLREDDAEHGQRLRRNRHRRTLDRHRRTLRVRRPAGGHLMRRPKMLSSDRMEAYWRWSIQYLNAASLILVILSAPPQTVPQTFLYSVPFKFTLCFKKIELLKRSNRLFISVLLNISIIKNINLFSV